MTNTQRARDLASYPYGRDPPGDVLATRDAFEHRIKAALDAAFREGVEAAARECDKFAAINERILELSDPMTQDTVLRIQGAEDEATLLAFRIRALLPDPVTAPGHTDLVVAPESIDAPVCETCGGRREVSHFVGSIGSGGEGYQVDPCPDCTPDLDAPDAVGTLAVLRSYEQWEADMIMENRAWTRTNGLPHITQELWNRLLEIQTARNAALALARPQK